MEFNFSPWRIAIFMGCLALFWALDGFIMQVPLDSVADPQRVRKAWIYCVLLFIAGAGCLSLVDHFVGTMERSNLRWLYIVMGIVLMGGSYLWISSIKQGLGTN